ncbi:RNA polymerase III subunit Rpc25-domain-containing protein [Stachybotrys elegans]|uniref:DNA-directed RNA polymerase subunit n=1 Tax=Stachybotrys elegans TaxID=80388 RepID=A0A8K0T0R4_9HYPO|nr:RNA polymerase III subunit Rpc25-domain-containing protein [Stachybotrys elegans]
MFILTKIADLVQIAPADFSKTSIVAIEDNINAKYSNKVIQKIGLCICLYDLLWFSEGLIGHGTGLVNVNVEFRMVVFRPFKGEVMLARIRSSTPAGINLRTDFFDDIFVPYEELPPGAEYNHSEQLWIWNFDGESLFYDIHEMVRFQVIDEEWHDQTPAGPTQTDEAAVKTPYRIKGSMARDGLGVCLWWDGAE